MNPSGKSKTLPLVRVLVEGSATAKVLVLQESLSFWGGVDPLTGNIIDSHHPQCGQSISQTLLVLPGIKGSTAGSGALLECLYSGNGPAALLLCQTDTSAIIAVTAYQALSGITIPVAEITVETAQQLKNDTKWCVEQRYLTALP